MLLDLVTAAKLEAEAPTKTVVVDAHILEDRGAGTRTLEILEVEKKVTRREDYTVRPSHWVNVINAAFNKRNGFVFEVGDCLLEACASLTKADFERVCKHTGIKSSS